MNFVQIKTVPGIDSIAVPYFSLLSPISLGSQLYYVEFLIGFTLFFSCWELRIARKTRHVPNTWLYHWATSSLVENKSSVSGFCCFPLLDFAYAFSMKKSYFVFSYINLCTYHLETSFYIYYSDVGGPRTTGESQFSRSTVWVGSLNSGHQTR